jgi:serine protease Do
MKTFISVLGGFFVGALFTSALFFGNGYIQEVESPIEHDSEITVISEEEYQLIDSIDQVYDSVVLVENIDEYGYLGSTGTGFIYKQVEGGYLLATNHHVIDGASKINLVFPDGKIEEDIEIVGSDDKSDLALLKLSTTLYHDTLDVGVSDELQIGQSVFAIGSPLGEDYINTVTKGIVSGLDRMVNSEELVVSVIQTDTAINPGNSGGPLLTLDGKVIGINSLKLVQSEVEGMGFALPIDEAMSILDKIEENGEVVRPTFGIRTYDVEELTEKYRQDYNIPESQQDGVLVVQVLEGTAADNAGVLDGDIIVSFEGESIKNVFDFRMKLYEFSSGDTVVVEVLRDGEIIAITVRLDNTPI